MLFYGKDPEDDLEYLCIVHDLIIDASGGVKGFHDEGLVRSALARPLQTAFGEDVYKTDFYKAAALLESVARNHGFRDGNKRTAMAITSIYLQIKGRKLDITQQEYEDLVLYVVNDKPKLDEIAEWLERHSK